MSSDFDKPIRKRVGGSLSNLPVMDRIEMLRNNALLLKKQTRWSPPNDNGTLVRKVVGKTR